MDGQPTTGMPLAPLDGDREIPQRVVTSIDVTTDEGRKLAYRAVVTDDLKAADHLNEEFLVRDWLTHDATTIDEETGEMRVFVRTVLVLEDGRLLSAGSNGVCKNLGNLVRFFGPAPWVPARRLKICQRKGRGPNKYYVIEPL